MSNIYNPEITPALEYSQGINQMYDNPLPPILATEVFAEFEQRCANGMQYTTFPNTISDAEKAKLEEKGYIITRNTVPSDVRYGQGDLYIGFQVALNARAAEEAMQITPNDEGSITLVPKNITENGIYDPADDGADGYSSVNVEVSPTLENKSVTPTTSEQTITAGENYDGLGTVTVEAVTAAIDQNIVAGNIKKDAVILGITGDYDPQPNLEALSVTPTTSAQSITPESPVEGYSQVSVSAVTSAIDQNITAGNIKKDVTILGVTGSYEGQGIEFSATPASFTLLTNIKNLNAVIPNGVTGIYTDAFKNCTGLVSIEIPSSVIAISSSAFYGCTGLTSVEIPSSVTIIGTSAFYGCTGLTDIIISNGVKTINIDAFYGCTGLTSVEIPSSVTTIGNNVFSGCTNLTTITIHKAEGSITGAPWGAPNATVIWNG